MLNIFSGSDRRLGAALTNMTDLALRKGKLSRPISVEYEGKVYSDLESAYQRLKRVFDPASSREQQSSATDAGNDALMVALIACKFRQPPSLREAVAKAGGAPFLEHCSHFTHAKSANFQAWEGTGRASRFIRNLIAGYEEACQTPYVAPVQGGLFGE